MTYLEGDNLFGGENGAVDFCLQYVVKATGLVTGANLAVDQGVGRRVPV